MKINDFDHSSLVRALALVAAFLMGVALGLVAPRTPSSTPDVKDSPIVFEQRRH
ncbi:MAG: hypothetical protein ACO29N_02590 [Candidatus Nanopelagicaceae bacterium]